MTARVVVLGGGVGGLATAILLARDGHDVSVLERDREPPPASVDEAWSSWRRTGVAQFRQPHFLQARVRRVLDSELPDVRDALVAAGAARVDHIARLPPAITDRAPRDGDERFLSITGRRSTTEYVFAQLAETEPRVNVRRGVEAQTLTARVSRGVPLVTGVRTGDGEELKADLVVDAMGRNSRLPRLLGATGAAELHEEAEDSGFIYFTRFFRSTNGVLPEPRPTALVTPIGSFSILTLPSDRDTWSVTLFVSSRDRPLRRLKEPERWSATVAACPLHAHWLEGEPISEVVAMGGVLDRYRRLVRDGNVVAAGHRTCRRRLGVHEPVARSRPRPRARPRFPATRCRALAPRRPVGVCEAWDAVTEAEFTPWYRATIMVDRARVAEMEALSRGDEVPRPTDAAATIRARFPAAAANDADLFRAFIEIVGCLTLPADVFARPGLADRILELTGHVKPPPQLGPTRTQLLELVA